MADTLIDTGYVVDQRKTKPAAAAKEEVKVEEAKVEEEKE